LSYPSRVHGNISHTIWGNIRVCGWGTKENLEKFQSRELWRSGRHVALSDHQVVHTFTNNEKTICDRCRCSQSA